jgi:hypothetical protein
MLAAVAFGNCDGKREGATSTAGEVTRQGGVAGVAEFTRFVAGITAYQATRRQYELAGCREP